MDEEWSGCLVLVVGVGAGGVAEALLHGLHRCHGGRIGIRPRTTPSATLVGDPAAEEHFGSMGLPLYGFPNNLAPPTPSSQTHTAEDLHRLIHS